MRPGRRAVVVGVLVGLMLGAQATSARLAARMVRLRMEGYVGPPPEGRREEADLTLRVDKTDQRFQVTKATLLSGGLASNVFDRVAPYKPSFVLRGPPELLSRVGDAMPGTRLIIVGQWRAGARDLMVGSIEPGSSP